MSSFIRSPLVLVLALWAAGLGAAAQFAKIVVIFPELQAHYGETGAASGYLVSLLSVVGMTLGLIAGVLATQIGVRRLLLAGLVLGALISGFQATLPGFEWMLASRFLEGLSHLAIVVSAPTLIAQLTVQRHQGMALTLWGTYFGVAFATVALTAPPILRTLGLAGLPALHAVYMAAFAVLLTALLPAPDGRDAPPWPSLAEIARRHVVVYSSPFIAAPALGWLFYTLTFVSMLAILPSMVEPTMRPFVAAAMPVASIISSMTAGNMLLRRLSAVAVIITGFSVAIALLMVFMLAGPDPWLFIALFAALGLVQGASFAAVPELNASTADRALGNGGIAQTGNIGNALGTPAMLAIASTGLAAGLPLFLIGCYACAIAVHLAMARSCRRVALGQIRPD
ncbi:putative MFS family arabinose efflux permease [Hoeflea marina]|uniref:Putative MFS family arabinose efflux permease n=1 Tax=Hoeflea marina TaxID=274592 RepID=A0A317PG60_9HYPH|nr:MFS transporter [Hoeflea marina]PWV99014.1 putative MFS family arabinose efflux permease [Hoeflea marina]